MIPRKLGIRVATLVVASAAAGMVFEVAVRLFVDVANVGPAFSAYHPTYHRWLKSDFSTVRHTPHSTFRLSTNSRGFRGPEIDSDLPSVLFLGDSFTMGYGVTDGDVFVDHVRQRLNASGRRLNVINVGISNNGQGRWLKFLRQEAPDLRPQAVVVQFTTNDYFDNLEEGLFRLQGGELRESDVPEPGTLRRFQSVVESVPLLTSTYSFALLQQALLPLRASVQGKDESEETGDSESSDSAEPELTIEERAEALTESLVTATLEFCRQNGWPVLGLTADIEDHRFDGLEEMFLRHEAPLLKLPVRSERPDLWFENDPHWNEAGHEFVTDLVMPWLRIQLDRGAE